MILIRRLSEDMSSSGRNHINEGKENFDCSNDLMYETDQTDIDTTSSNLQSDTEYGGVTEDDVTPEEDDEEDYNVIRYYYSGEMCPYEAENPPYILGKQ